MKTDKINIIFVILPFCNNGKNIPVCTKYSTCQAHWQENHMFTTKFSKVTNERSINTTTTDS